MRWHVHGTDAVTGQVVELEVDEPAAPQAIKSALDRQIVVSHVTPGVSKGPRRWVVPVAVAGFIAVAAVTVGLGIQNKAMRAKLDQALAEQTHMASSVAQAEHLAADIRVHGNLAQGAAAQVSQLADDLAAARNRMSLTEQQLSAANNQMTKLEKDAQRLPAVEKEMTAVREELLAAQRRLSESQLLAGELRGELALQGRRMEQLEKAPAALDPAPARATSLEMANQALAAEIEKLKGELLVMAAQATGPAVPVAESGPPVASSRWALRISFDAARSFMALNADQSSLHTVAAAEGLFATTGVSEANALQLRFVHDRNRERLYSATLTVSMATDAPREKLAENRQIIGSFLQAFSPTLKDADTVVAAALAQLATQDESRRLVFVTDDSKLTIWNNKAGTFTFRVESTHSDVE